MQHGCNLKNNRMISVHFQGKPFNITVIQVYAPTSNAEEAKVKWFYEDLQDPSRTNTQKRYPFHYRGLECKNRKSRDTWSIWLIDFCQENTLVTANTLPTTQEKTLHMGVTTWSIPKSD